MIHTPTTHAASAREEIFKLGLLANNLYPQMNAGMTVLLGNMAMRRITASQEDMSELAVASRTLDDDKISNAIEDTTNLNSVRPTQLS
jgi:hypothetical protein